MDLKLVHHYVKLTSDCEACDVPRERTRREGPGKALSQASTGGGTSSIARHRAVCTISSRSLLPNSICPPSGLPVLHASLCACLFAPSAVPSAFSASQQ